VNVRPLTEADLERVAAFLREDEERLFGRPSRIGATDVRQWTSETDLERHSWLYEDDDGLVAVAWLWPEPDVLTAIGVVHERMHGRGLGARLLERSERIARELGAPRIHQIAIGPDAAAGALMTEHGYRDVRRFYDMAIELGAPPEVPDNLPIEPFREEDARAFHDAMDEAFQDHWEHRSRSFEEWWERHSKSPSFDTSLWFLIRDGGEIAAVVRNEANRNGGGYIAAIGVRRPWRGKGYAKALLQRSFREFWDRGIPRVTLGVDAQNPTGATHLYERVGMHVEAENVVWEKRLA
jgi:GNAT superfamily N-acetyltransferase